MKTVAMKQEALNQARIALRHLGDELFTLTQEINQWGAMMPEWLFECKTDRMLEVQKSYAEQQQLLAYYQQQLA